MRRPPKRVRRKPMLMNRIQSSTPAAHRRKACFSCTRDKRRCDKQLPSCQRCLEREELCAYPRRPRYARQSLESSPRNTNSSILAPDDLLLPFPQLPLSLLTSTDPIEVDYGVRVDEHPSLPLGDSDVLGQNSYSRDQPHGAIEQDWFLDINSWSINAFEVDTLSNRSNLSQFKGLIKSIRKWLSHWTTEGHCPFIHQKLYYQNGLPDCLQDAYAMISAYAGKNENNEGIVLQLMEKKAEALLSSYSDDVTSPSALCLWDRPLVTQGQASQPSLPLAHLARVQAFFIFQFLRLFDGDVRQRAVAEQQMETLIQWRDQLWENARTTLSVCRPSPNFPSRTVVHQWHDWLLTESIRRTWLVVTYTNSVYRVLRDGEADCPGSIPHTMSRHLWNAPSAFRWSWYCKNHDPLFLRCDRPQELCCNTSRSDVDEFGLTMIGIMSGPDILGEWVDDGNT